MTDTHYYETDYLSYRFLQAPMPEKYETKSKNVTVTLGKKYTFIL